MYTGTSEVILSGPKNPGIAGAAYVTRTRDPIITNKGYPPKTGAFSASCVLIYATCADFVRVTSAPEVHMYIGPKADCRPLPTLTTNERTRFDMATGIPTPVRGVVQTSKGEIPDWLPPAANGQCQGYHCDQRMVAALYMPDGALFKVLCTDGGGDIWPPKEVTTWTGKFSTGFVYFLQAENGLIKIGFATDVERRVARLRTMSPVRLTLLATISKDGMRTETEYHALFSRHRRHGEWFAPHQDILAEIARLNGGRT